MRLAVFVLVLACPLAHADEDWGALRYLVGNWTGEGGGGPGQGSGWFSFQPDVQGKVLVRKNHSEYPATNGQQPTVHDDLMIVYREPDSTGERGIHAIYFDNEDHIIRYTVTMFGDKVIFTSDAAIGPRYRLTYTRAGSDGLRIKFEIAPPSRDFTTYLEAGAKRAK